VVGNHHLTSKIDHDKVGCIYRRIMKKQRILFDMDGCLADFVGGIILFVQINFPFISLTRDHCNEWDIFAKITDHRAQAEAIAHMCSPGFFRNLEPIKPALKAYHALVMAQHDVVICTTPLWDQFEAQSRADKLGWLEEHIGQQAALTTIFSFDKTTEFADVIIDDKPNLTEGKSDIQFKNWIIVDHLYNQRMQSLGHYPVGRINNDWSNWEVEFAKLELI
jgi:5'-nucleotidase